MSRPNEDNDWYGDLRPILDDDLARFVAEQDRYRSLTVVADPRDHDAEADTRRWLDALRADPATTAQCDAMRRAVERWADRSRDGQLRGALAVVRLDALGHAGVAAALDQLWSVRAKDRRDYDRVIAFARRRVVESPSPADRHGCRCTTPPAPTRPVLTGILRAVLNAPSDRQAPLLRWATARLRGYAAAGQLPPDHAERLVEQLRGATGSAQ